MRVGYVFKYSFSAEIISPISVILATLIKNGETFSIETWTIVAGL